MFSRLKSIISFIRVEALSGVFLIAATVAAILLKNSSASKLYDDFIHSSVLINLGADVFTISSHFVVNDILMTIFFLVVGLEIKREVLSGELSTAKTALLPAIGALGGMLVPALIYILFNSAHPATIKGWAIPTATDIAFSLGILSLLGKRVPFGLKIFLTALAIFDDLLAVLIIAGFYTKTISVFYLCLVLLTLGIMYMFNRIGKDKFRYYLLPGFFLVSFMYFSGVHATIAGVLLAMMIPLKGKHAKSKSPLKKLEHILHPWVAYGVLPIFAFFNSGIDLQGISLSMLTDSVTLGCLLGLFLGKQLGVFTFSWMAVKYNLASLPENVTWKQFYAVGILTGIGFTMSLFIGNLAFTDPAAIELTKLGVICGSLLSAIVGSVLLLNWGRLPITKALQHQ